MTITTQMRTEVSQLYVALFGRAPEAEGLNFWAGLRDSGQTMTQLADAMFATAPARAYFPSTLTHQEIISSFYFNVLGRQADAGGLAFWTAKLDAAGATPGSVITEMIGVIANYAGADPAGLTSAALFNNRSAAAQFYGEHNGSLEHGTSVLSEVSSDASTVLAARTLNLQPGASGTVNTAGFSEISLSTLSGDITLSHMAAGTELLVTASTSKVIADPTTGGYNMQWAIICQLENSSGTNDSIAVTMKSVDTIVVGSLNLPGIERLALTSVDTDVNSHYDVVYMANGQNLASLVVAGSVETDFGNEIHADTFDATGTHAGSYVNMTTVGGAVILGGSGNDALYGWWGNNTITGGAGDDEIGGGRGMDILTGGPGADSFVLTTSFNGNEFATITDFTKSTQSVAGDHIELGWLLERGTATWHSSKLTLNGSPTFDAYLDAAAAATNITTTLHRPVHWFQYGGDTYIAVDNSDAATFQSGHDRFVKLVGLVDLGALSYDATEFSLG